MRAGSVRAFDFVPAERKVRRTRGEVRRARDVVPALAARIAGREIYRRCLRIGKIVIDVSERVAYAVVKQS
jgi:hypothetical protein